MYREPELPLDPPDNTDEPLEDDEGTITLAALNMPQIDIEYVVRDDEVIVEDVRVQGVCIGEMLDGLYVFNDGRMTTVHEHLEQRVRAKLESPDYY